MLEEARLLGSMILPSRGALLPRDRVSCLFSPPEALARKPFSVLGDVREPTVRLGRDDEAFVEQAARPAIKVVAQQELSSFVLVSEAQAVRERFLPPAMDLYQLKKQQQIKVKSAQRSFMNVLVRAKLLLAVGVGRLWLLHSQSSAHFRLPGELLVVESWKAFKAENLCGCLESLF